MVIVWHYVTCQPKLLASGSLFSYMHLPTTAFWSGVDLFFVLSGFLIGGNILDNYSKQFFLKVFWIRRACRIFPVLLVLVITCYISRFFLDENQFSWLFSNLMPWWTYASFTQNIAMGLRDTFGGHYLGVTWSLAVEEQFYLIAPLIIIVFGKTVWIRSLIPLILTAFILRLFFPGFQTYVNTIFRMDSLLLGVLVAVMYRKREVWSFLLVNRGVLLAVFLCLLILTGALLQRGLGNFKFLWFAILYSTFLVVALLYQQTKVTWFLRSWFLSFWGSIAYGLYMYHQAISGLLHGWLCDGVNPSLTSGYGASITGIAFLLSTAIAWLSFKYFESVFLRIGKQQKYGPIYNNIKR